MLFKFELFHFFLVKCRNTIFNKLFKLLHFLFLNFLVYSIVTGKSQVCNKHWTTLLFKFELQGIFLEMVKLTKQNYSYFHFLWLVFLSRNIFRIFLLSGKWPRRSFFSLMNFFTMWYTWTYEFLKHELCMLLNFKKITHNNTHTLRVLHAFLHKYEWTHLKEHKVHSIPINQRNCCNTGMGGSNFFPHDSFHCEIHWFVDWENYFKMQKKQFLFCVFEHGNTRWTSLGRIFELPRIEH